MLEQNKDCTLSIVYDDNDL